MQHVQAVGFLIRSTKFRELDWIRQEIFHFRRVWGGFAFSHWRPSHEQNVSCCQNYPTAEPFQIKWWREVIRMTRDARGGRLFRSAKNNNNNLTIFSCIQKQSTFLAVPASPAFRVAGLTCVPSLHASASGLCSRAWCVVSRQAAVLEASWAAESPLHYLWLHLFNQLMNWLMLCFTSSSSIKLLVFGKLLERFQKMLLTKSPRRHYMQIGYKNNSRKYNALPWSAQIMTLMNLS